MSIIGEEGERFAAEYLKKQGYTLLERNFRIRGGEIDIIARLAEEIIFFEVKSRSNSNYGYPEEGVDFFKKKHIARAVKEYIRKLRISESTYLRFDVIAIEFDQSGHVFNLRHIKNIELPT